MEIEIRTGNIFNQYADDIWALLVECNDEFLPPLSVRSDTSQSNLKPVNKGNNEPIEYFHSLEKQSTIVALCDGKVVGFLSYVPHYTLNIEGYDDVCYMSTIIVGKQFRRYGAAIKMYREFMSSCNGYCLATRTWSSNDIHMRLLEGLGFNEIARIENDRGNGIDTVYFVCCPV